MKIAQSNLALQSNHMALNRQQNQESLRVWRGERPNFEAAPSAVSRISDMARQMLDATPFTPSVPAFKAAVPAPQTLPQTTASQQTQVIEDAQDAAKKDPFIAMMVEMIRLFTGQDVKIFDSSEFSATMEHARSSASQRAQTLQTEATASNGRVGWGMEYDAHSLREEFEQTRFSANGTVRTTDGKEISFQLDLEMTRYYREESHTRVRAGDAAAVRKDPIVVNFGGSAVELASQAGRTFRFDLDSDGAEETLPLFNTGSGYLALDLDGNGRIDSGKELFGPRTGQGFAELALLDHDGNGWIDENDPAFKQLSVWVPSAEGNGKLYTLADLDIGALALAHAATPHALRSSENRDLGVVKNSSVYLTESGRVGSLQEIDLTV